MTENIKVPASGQNHETTDAVIEDHRPDAVASQATPNSVLQSGMSPVSARIVSRILTSLFAAASVRQDNHRFSHVTNALRELRTEIADLGYEVIRLEGDFADSGLLDHIIDIAVSQSGIVVAQADSFAAIIAQYPERLRGIAETLDVLKRRQPAVPISESVTPDYLVCLEDGRKLKLLKRHLKQSFNMTPEQYRARWGLPDDYPMVAENYSKVRSKLAHENGLGHKSDLDDE